MFIFSLGSIRITHDSTVGAVNYSLVICCSWLSNVEFSISSIAACEGGDEWKVANKWLFSSLIKQSKYETVCSELDAIKILTYCNRYNKNLKSHLKWIYIIIYLKNIIKNKLKLINRLWIHIEKRDEKSLDKVIFDLFRWQIRFNLVNDFLFF